MKRLFNLECGPFGQTCKRTLEVGDNIRIGNTTYRVMEQPIDDIIQCAPHNPNLPQDYVEFHENGVDEVVWAQYTDW